MSRSLVANFVPEGPRLTPIVSQLGALVLVWPTNGAGFVLQENSNLGTTNWTTATNSIGIKGTNDRE